MSVFTRTAMTGLLQAAQLAEQVNGIAPPPGSEMQQATLVQLSRAADLAAVAALELEAEYHRLARET